MSYVRIWIHCVFSTRDREPYFTKEIRQKLIEHIKINARAKSVFIEAINGWSDHLHVLISLGKEQDVAKVMMLIKGESAHWLNQQDFFKGKFYWQDDYYAISVSESQLEEVKGYIARQETHHQAVPHAKEIETLEQLMGR